MNRQKAAYDHLRQMPDKLCICCGYTEYVEDDFVYNAIKIFEGDTFIHIGEGDGGCTGSARMWCELSKNWRMVKSFDHPNWNRVNSFVQVYKRKL